MANVFAAMHLRASYTLTCEGNLGARVEITRERTNNGAAPEVLIRNRHFLAITPKERANLNPFYPEAQLKLLNWTSELLRAASILGPAVLASNWAPGAHIRDLRVAFEGEFAIRSLGIGRAEMELSDGRLVISAASRPQRGLWRCQMNYAGEPQEEADIFIVENNKRVDFRDPPAILVAWRALREQILAERVETLRALLDELPRPGETLWSA